MRLLATALALAALLSACERRDIVSQPPLPDAFLCALRVEICDDIDNDCNGVVDDTGVPEICEGLDNDCDGLIDEGASCVEYDAPGAGGWTLGPSLSGVLVLDDGALTLEPPPVDLVHPALWIANTDEGTVSRLDPLTGRETARYASVDRGGLPFGAVSQPSRTALDQQLDAYVANRAFDGLASVTKIAGSLERCVDRDADGILETSSDLDGDGTISLDPALGEFLGTLDECLLWTAAVGGPNAVARALAIGLPGADGLPGDVWVGLFTEQVVLVLSRDLGAQIASIPLGLSPYGAVTGADGRIWLTAGPAPSTFMVAVDPETYEVERVPLPIGVATYGISVDGLGRVILAGATGERGPRWRGVAAYDPVRERWTRSPSLDVSPLGYPVRGVAASAGSVWLAARSPSEQSVLFELSVADLSLTATHVVPGARDIVGVGVAFDGGIWGIAKGSDAAYRLDRATGEIESFPVGHTPYTYSDFTGFGLNGILGATGIHRVVVEGCRSTVWTGLRLDADIPEDTAVSLSVRSADTLEALELELWTGPFAPPSPSLALPPGPIRASRFLEISLRLTSRTAGVVPQVRSVTAVGRCDGVS